MNLTPLGQKIIIKCLRPKEKVGTIIVPVTAQEKPQMGIVQAIGKGPEEFQVKEGDKVLFAKYSGTEIEFDGEKFLIMNEEDILAIVE